MQNKDRTLLTSIGTKMREIDSDIWVKYIIKNCRDLENVVIDDLRYQNEYRYLIENNFKIIVLTLPVEIQIERIMKLYPENYKDHLNNMFHVSEKGIDFIDNDRLNIDMSQDIETIRDIIYKYLMT
jgi:dephospho-CoA kinase